MTPFRHEVENQVGPVLFLKFEQVIEKSLGIQLRLPLQYGVENLILFLFVNLFLKTRFSMLYSNIVQRIIPLEDCGSS